MRRFEGHRWIAFPALNLSTSRLAELAGQIGTLGLLDKSNIINGFRCFPDAAGLDKACGGGSTR
jgi:hypothetical protein